MVLISGTMRAQQLAAHWRGAAATLLLLALLPAAAGGGSSPPSGRGAPALEAWGVADHVVPPAARRLRGAPWLLPRPRAPGAEGAPRGESREDSPFAVGSSAQLHLRRAADAAAPVTASRTPRATRSGTRSGTPPATGTPSQRRTATRSAKPR